MKYFDSFFWKESIISSFLFHCTSMDFPSRIIFHTLLNFILYWRPLDGRNWGLFVFLFSISGTILAYRSHSADDGLSERSKRISLFLFFIFLWHLLLLPLKFWISISLLLHINMLKSFLFVKKSHLCSFLKVIFRGYMIG